MPRAVNVLFSTINPTSSSGTGLQREQHFATWIPRNIIPCSTSSHVFTTLLPRLSFLYRSLPCRTHDFILTSCNPCSPKVSKWASLDTRTEVIRRVIAKSSFKSMRRKEESTGLLIFDDKYPQRNRGWRMMRKGQTGTWEECFTTPVSKDIWNERAFKTMLDLGYVTDEHW